MSRTRRFFFALVTILLVLIVVEGLAQVFAAHIVRQGKLFDADSVLGWRPRPNLDLVRLNANGESWRIQTDERGVRGPASWNEEAAKRILILGDSFAFGEGVDVEERFDRVIARRRQDWSIINLGVMGYGTDQQVIASREYVPSLRAGDVLVIVTYSNDLFDVLRTRFSGRAKPWFEETRNGLVEHPPHVGWAEILRDRSYLIARLASFLEAHRRHTPTDMRRGADLYRAILLQELNEWKHRRLRVVLVRHGLPMLDNAIEARIFDDATTAVCVGSIQCLDLDPAMLFEDRDRFLLDDGHWNAAGHAKAAEILERRLVSVLRP